jgi:hypothetical protein
MIKYQATWVESGTGDREWSGLCDTPEQARGQAFQKCYPPIPATIQIIERKQESKNVE